MAIQNEYIIRVSERGAKKTQQSLKGVNGSLNTMAKKAGLVAAAFFGSRMLLEGMRNAVELSGKFEGISQGFKKLSKEAGFSASIFKKLQTATDGTINSMDLMTQANNAMLLGIFDSDEQMVQMFDNAQRLAKALGKDATFGVESLVTGMGRQSKLMLDNLGIMVKSEDAYKRYAKELGVSVTGLTDQQKKQAFVNEAMKQATSLVATLGDETLTTADQINIAKTAMLETQIAIGDLFAPAVEGLAKMFAIASKNVKSFVDGIRVAVTGLADYDPFENFREGLEGLSEDQLLSQIKLLSSELTELEKPAKKVAEVTKEVTKAAELDVQILGIWTDETEDLLAQQFGLNSSISIMTGNIEDQVKVVEDLNAENKGVTTTTIDMTDRITDLSLKIDILKEALKTLREATKAGGDEIEKSFGAEQKEKLEAFFKKWGESINTTISGFSAMTGAMKQEVEARYQTELSALKDTEKYRNADSERRADMEKDLNKKFAKERLRLWKHDKNAQLAQAGVNIATAITKVLPNMILAGLVGTMGAYQLHAIQSTQPPKFATGGLVGGRRHSAGGTTIEAEHGEFVMNRNAVNRIGVSGLNAMNQGGSGVTVNISAPLLDDTIADSIIPKIQEAVRRGSSLGV